MKRRELEDKLTDQFRAAGFEQPGFEARRLLTELSESAGDEGRAEEWAAHRLRGVPLAYLSGKKGFYKNVFLVGHGVLVPRPETEHVVEVALRRAAHVRHFADLGSGSGCVGLSLLRELPTAQLLAVDSNPTACEFTARNALLLQLEGRLQVVNARVEEWKPPAALDLVVANPPYIAIGDLTVQPSVHEHEPASALYSGADGLDAIRAWSRWSERYLVPGGLVVCEFGAGQSATVREIMGQLNFEQIQIDRDLSGKERVISATKAR